MTAWSENSQDRLQLEHHFLDNAKRFDWDAVKALLTETPNFINVQPSGRWSALHQAAYEGNVEMVTYLLNQRADLTAVSGKGETVQDIAQRDVVAILAEAHKGVLEDERTTAISSGAPITITAVSAVSGDVLATVQCSDGDDVAALCSAIAAQDALGAAYYQIFAEGSSERVGGITKLAKAGIVDGCQVSVVRIPGPSGTVEVASIGDAWEKNPGTRYPVTLAVQGRFFATPECKEEDEVFFSNIDFSGGFQRSFTDGRKKDSKSLNYVPIFALDTGTMHVMPIIADEARFGGIVIQPHQHSDP